MNENRIYPSKKSIIKTIAIFSLILLVLLFGIFSSRFAWAYKDEPDLTPYIIQDIIVLIVWIIVTAISGYVLLKKSYYAISKSCLTHHRLSAEVTYDFDHVIYIDEDYTEKHKTLLFYLSNGKSIFLVLDDGGEVLKAFRKNCNKLISREEFHAKFPKVKL